MKSTLVVALLLVVSGLPSLAWSASAEDSRQQAWPLRSVRIVVPSSPGGGTDRYARLIAQALTESLKQTFVIDNRPGAAGNVGAEIAARAAPDGYTFLVSANPALAINASLYKNLAYNAERDFTPVARGVSAPAVIASHPSVPVKTLAALIALGKRDPGKLPYGSAGAGSPGHLNARMLEEASGARFIHVPYKGVGQALQGLLRGEVGFILADITSVLPFIREGRLVALAVTEPTPLLPAIPSVVAAGSPGVTTYGTSFSVVAPAGTSPVIVQRMSGEVMKAMRSSALKEKLEGLGYVPVFDTPEEFAASLKKERQVWADVIRRNNVVPD
jgi:tripartite-type tricarboxylate transporter receptor subunit TctC